MKIIISLFIVLAVSGCARIANNLQLYKLEANSVDKTLTEGSKTVELEYHGEKGESVSSAVSRWMNQAEAICDSADFTIYSPSFSRIMFEVGDVRSYGDLTVVFPERGKEHWPQVLGQIDCPCFRELPSSDDLSFLFPEDVRDQYNCFKEEI
ncbi:hypothetical protein [Microbulbifer sp. Q7]|uniref:hypothetical protein n=1 Tax=Microbulbifer sp. Q7 TaxID=1785091 RepID=UPI00082A12E6|nr:hypothetical protein [Microbulbifer sp. Q7]